MRESIRNAQIAHFLQAHTDEKYRTFSGRLLPGVKNLMGVRLPVLRKLAHELAGGEWREYLMTASDDYFEEIMLQGMTLGFARASVEEKAPYIARFIPKIDNWSVCDSFCSAFKAAKTEPEAMLALVDGYLMSERTYAARFAIVQLLMYYMDARQLPQTLERLERVRAQGEAAQVAVAWALSVAYKTDERRTVELLQTGVFPATVTQWAWRKIVELSCVGPDKREELRRLQSGPEKKNEF